MRRASRLCLALLLALFSALTLPSAAWSRALRADEQVMFVPSTARLLDDGRIEARIEAWVYEIEVRPGLNGVFAKHLRLKLKNLSITDRQRFKASTQLFRVDSQSFKDLRISMSDLCCSAYALPRTNFAGRSSARIVMPADAKAAQQQWLRFSVQMPTGDARQFRGRALLVPTRGVSVISDIDDTIKISQVRDRRALLLNTFLRPFVAVPGMAQRYTRLAKQPGTVFHYVSSAPMQLYPLLRPFLRDSGFPAGSVHLRESTSLVDLIAHPSDSRAHKMETIQGLLADFPERRFLLIGDSGEADPEIYGDIARAHRVQIIGIQIRDVSAETADILRYRTAFAELPAQLWEIYPSGD